MTTEQRERLLGQVLSGVEIGTACDCLGIGYLEVLEELKDEAFGTALLTAIGAAEQIRQIDLSDGR